MPKNHKARLQRLNNVNKKCKEHKIPTKNRYLKRFLEDALEPIIEPLDMDPLDEQSAYINPADSDFTDSCIESVQFILNRFKFHNERAKQIFLLRFDEEKTLDEVGKEMGVSRERIRQIEFKTWKQIRFVLTKQGLNPWYGTYPDRTISAKDEQLERNERQRRESIQRERELKAQEIPAYDWGKAKLAWRETLHRKLIEEGCLDTLVWIEMNREEHFLVWASERALPWLRRRQARLPFHFPEDYICPSMDQAP